MLIVLPVGLQMTPEELKELDRLHRDCLTSLNAFIEQAKKTCDLLETIKAFPVDLKARKEIIAQRVRENAAHELYQRARQKLFEAAKWM